MGTPPVKWSEAISSKRSMGNLPMFQSEAIAPKRSMGNLPMFRSEAIFIFTKPHVARIKPSQAAIRIRPNFQL
jgi:hypothetical protein